jgi:hypothetical protein
MPDMGFRDNVMGPQPIAKRTPVPQSLLDTVARILDLVIDGKGAELVRTTVDTAKAETAELAAAIKPGSYRDKAVVAIARTNEHYWIKARLTGPDAKPFTFQFRLGPDGDGWIIWQATNLSDSRSAWTR